MHFLSILAPFWPPTWGSTGGPVGTFWWSCWALGAILGPTWPQEPSKRPSWPDFEAILGLRWPQEPSKRPSWPHFAMFWVPSWRVWGANLVDLGCQLDGFGPLLVGSQPVRFEVLAHDANMENQTEFPALNQMNPKLRKSIV